MFVSGGFVLWFGIFGSWTGGITGGIIGGISSWEGGISLFFSRFLSSGFSFLSSLGISSFGSSLLSILLLFSSFGSLLSGSSSLFKGFLSSSGILSKDVGITIGIIGSIGIFGLLFGTFDEDIFNSLGVSFLGGIIILSLLSSGVISTVFLYIYW